MRCEQEQMGCRCHRDFRLLNCFCTSPISLLFHSPTHAPLLLPVIHTLDERLGGGVMVTDAAIRACVGVNTISGGIFSPSVRFSLAIRLRRISASEGSWGPSDGDGDNGTGPTHGESGTRVSVGETGTALMRRTSGRGPSAARRPFVDFGVGQTSRLGRDSWVNDTREEFEDDAEYRDSLDEASSEKDAISGNSVKTDAWRRDALVCELAFGLTSGHSSGSASRGVVPSTAPSLRVERMRRARWHSSRLLHVSGGMS